MNTLRSVRAKPNTTLHADYQTWDDCWRGVRQGAFDGGLFQKGPNSQAVNVSPGDAALADNALEVPDVKHPEVDDR